MEQIWDDLCRTEKEVISPSWHEDVLRAREEKTKAGEDSFIDWKVAERNIKRKTS